MEKFDIGFKFTVIGIKTFTDLNARAASETFKQNLIDTIEAELGEGAMLQTAEIRVNLHSPGCLQIEFADIAGRKAAGFDHFQKGVVPYSEDTEDFTFEDEKEAYDIEEDIEDEVKAPDKPTTDYPRGMGNNEHRCGAY